MARICLRGETESLIRNSFAIAPTESKEMLRILIATYVNSPDFICSAVDISQASIQSDVLAAKASTIALVPESIHLDGLRWQGESFRVANPIRWRG